MEIFPQIMLRVTGLPLQYLDDINWSATKVWEAVLEEESRLKTAKVTLQENLSKAIGSHPDYKAKNTLANLIKDLLHNRPIKSSKYQSVLIHSKEAEDCFCELEDLVKREKRVGELVLNWNAWYEKELLCEREKLKHLAAHPSLLNGMPLSSLSIFKRWKSYLEKSFHLHRKKERQTERTLLQYLTRVATKTSPFSSYTTLSLQSLKKPKIDFKPQVSFRLNNYILFHFQSFLESIPAFYKQLLIKKNPSLLKEDGRWKYLFNSKNVESLQEMEANEFVDWILNQFQGESIMFGDLLVKALEMVDAAEEGIHQFFIQLIDLGLLEWDWGISGSEVNWLEGLAEFIKSKNTFEEQVTILELLNDLKDQVETIKMESPEGRVSILKHTEQRISSFFNSKKSEKEIVTDQEEEVGVFKRISNSEFGFRAEKIFYEDVSSQHPDLIEQKDLEPILEKITHLIKSVQPIALPEFQAEIYKHYLKHFNDSTSVSLLDFYNSFYRERSGELFLEEGKNLEVEQVLASLEKKVSDHPAKILNLSLEECLEILSPFTEEKVGAPIGKAHGAMLHLSSGKTGIQEVFVEANFMGYGKMMGRFLHLFPEQLKAGLNEWNQSMEEEEVWIENVDASYFNANLHPHFLKHEIASPGSQNTRPVEQLISIMELEVIKGEKSLELRHRPTNKIARIFNFGFEAIESRSPMYQLLQGFAFQVPSLDLLTQLMDTAMVQYLPAQVVRLPRLVIDNTLILKRCRWFFPKGELPQLDSSSNKESLYFLEIQRWRKKWDLPQEIFITLHPQLVPGKMPTTDLPENVNSDDRKPQYIHLENPLLIQLLGRLFRRAGNVILVEEMWPQGGDSLDPSGHGVEVLVEWKS